MTKPRSWRPGGLVLTFVVAAMALVSAGCGSSADKEAQEGLDSVSTSIPAGEDEIDATIDTSKVKKNLTVGALNPHYLFHSDILVALEKGYFDEVGIESVEIKILDDPIPALIGGSLDFANYDTDSIMGAAKQSDSAIRFLGVKLGGEFVALGARSGFESAADLKGAKISGGEFDTRNDANLRELLRDNGVDPDKDVQMVSTGGGSNERLAAILSGTIDAGNVQLRHRTLIEKEGGTILFERLEQVPQSGWAAAEIMRDSPETAAAFMTALLKGRAYVDDPANKDEVVQLMEEKDFEMLPEYIAAYEDENAPDYNTVDGGFEAPDMDQFIEDAIEMKTAPAGTEWRDYTDLLPLWRAQKALGLPLRPSLESVAGD